MMDEFAFLGDIFDSDYKLIEEINQFLEKFNRKIRFIEFLQTSELGDFLEGKSPNPPPIKEFYKYMSVDDIKTYLSEDGETWYQDGIGHTYSKDYPKDKKKRDIITSICFTDENYSTEYLNINDFTFNILNKFHIICTIERKNGYSEHHVDLHEKYKTVDLYDCITLHELKPKRVL
jgi:hypothetical protein